MATKKDRTQDISRKQAAAFIDEVLLLAHKLEEDAESLEGGAKVASHTIVEHLATMARKHGLTLPGTCHGEAHSNPFIDHCGTCLGYRWGIAGEHVKVK